MNQRPTMARRTPRTRISAGGVVEAVDLVGLAAKGLDEQGATNGEGLLHLGVEDGELFLRFGDEVALDVADAAGGDDEDREEGGGEDREMPIEGEHEGEGGAGGDDVADHAAEGVADYALDRANIVADAAEDFAGAVGSEPAQGHAREVAVELAADVVHDTLADGVAEVGLGDAHECGDANKADHRNDERVQQPGIAGVVARVRERVVDDLLGEQRRAEANDRT